LIRCKNSQPGWFGVYLLFLPEGDGASLQNVTFLECCVLIRQWTKSNWGAIIIIILIKIRTKIGEAQITQETGAGDN